MLTLSQNSFAISDGMIDVDLLGQILQNVLSEHTAKEANHSRILLDLLNAPSTESQKEKRNFKTLPTTQAVPICDAKQYCITKLLTFECLQCLIQSAHPINDQKAECPSFEILCALMKFTPISMMKRLLRHNFVFDEDPNVSLLCLDIISVFIESQYSFYRQSEGNNESPDISDNRFNAVFHDWIRMDFFKCILMMFSLFSFPEHPQFRVHCDRIKQIVSNVLSFCSTKQLELIQDGASGYFEVENRSLVLRETENKENDINLDEDSLIDLADDIDLELLRKLYLTDNVSSEECNVLIVGDGDFTFSKGLVSLWPHITAESTLKLSSSTFHDIATFIQKYHHCDIANTVCRIQTASPSHRVLFGVDATDLSRFSNHHLFDRIIFNFPQTETSKGDHRLKSANQQLIFQFLKSVKPIMAEKGAVFIALHINEFEANLLRGARKDDEVERKKKNGKRYVEMRAMERFENVERVMRVSHDQFYTWDVSKVLTRKELKWITLERSIPFHAHWYPGYHATNVKGQGFDFCKAKIHVFRRLLK